MIETQYEVGDRIGGELSVIDVFGGAGKSGMGVVYLVKDRETSFPYVLKTFQQKANTEAAKQFIAEAHAWIQAGVHENIVKAFWVREIDGQLFIAAEYISKDDEDRNTLASFLNGGQLKLSTILNWSAQFCYGMTYALTKGVLFHRDIKPDNLMIARDGTLKITDFGLAKAVSVENVIDDEVKEKWYLKNSEVRNTSCASSNTQTGSTFGTPPYMSPEQFLDAKGVDFRTDIYSFGIILFELASGGSYPYKEVAEPSPNLILKFAKLHLQADPASIQSPLMPIIQKCLSKQREMRYETYDALLMDIQNIAIAHDIKIVLRPTVGQSVDEELYSKAQSFIALKQPQNARKAIDAYVTKYPYRYCGWTEKSRIHLDQNELEQAISAAKRSLDLFPYNSHAWNNLGEAYRRYGRSFEEAQNAFERALEYDPQNTGIMMNLAKLLQENSVWAQIPELLVTALELRPQKDTLRFNAGNIAAFMIKAERFNDASVILEKLIDTDPNNLDAIHNLALLNWQLGESLKAVGYFEKIVQLNPKDVFAWESLAKLYFNSKKAKETVRCCKKLLSMGEAVSISVSMVAQVMNWTGNYPGAVKFLEDYLHKQPENDVWWFVLSEIHEYRNNRKAALSAAIMCQNILMKYRLEADPENIRQVESKILELSE